MFQNYTKKKTISSEIKIEFFFEKLFYPTCLITCYMWDRRVQHVVVLLIPQVRIRTGRRPMVAAKLISMFSNPTFNLSFN